MVKKKPLDLKGYYRTLKVRSDASAEEIRLSYAMARQDAAGPFLRKIDEAFDTLRDATRRTAYDRQGLEGRQALKRPSTLAGAMALLAVVVAGVYGPELLRGLKKFRPGQTLVEARTGREFGEVVRFEDSHRFPQGGSAPAYLVRIAGSKDQRWLPAYDVQAVCDGR